MLNRCLDDAIAGAVTEYGRLRDQLTLDREVARGGERLGYFAHELRNMVSTAIVAFDVLKTGNIGVAGSTGTVLHRSLIGLRALIARSLAEVRLTEGVQNPEPFLPPGNVEDLFRPFAQRSVDRTRLGFGLAFGKWGVESNHGRLQARDLPERGCIFTIDLPRGHSG